MHEFILKPSLTHLLSCLYCTLQKHTHTLIFVCLLKDLLTVLMHWSRANVQKKNRGKTKSHSQITGINQHEETESRKQRASGNRTTDQMPSESLMMRLWESENSSMGECVCLKRDEGVFDPWHQQLQALKHCSMSLSVSLYTKSTG